MRRGLTIFDSFIFNFEICMGVQGNVFFFGTHLNRKFIHSGNIIFLNKTTDWFLIYCTCFNTQSVNEYELN